MIISLHERIAITCTNDQFSRQQNQWLGTIWNFKRHTPKLISLQAEHSRKLVLKPRYKIGNRVRIAKEDLPFKKSYK